MFLFHWEICHMGSCEGEYVHWIAKVFGECVVTSKDKWSFAFGIMSTLIWMWSQLPQIYLNFKNQCCEGLALGFLLFLTVGDISNLVGCLLTGGLVTQIITSSFFCIMDGFCLLQYFYFEFLRPRFFPGIKKDYNNEVHTMDESNPTTIAAAATAVIAAAYPNPYSKELLLGTLIGWLSTIVYASSRGFQIYKNYKRKKTEGISAQFYISAFLGNLTYAISIFIKDSHWGYVWLQLPWIIGSIGPILLDTTVLIQFFIYKHHIDPDESNANKELFYSIAV